MRYKTDNKTKSEKQCMNKMRSLTLLSSLIGMHRRTFHHEDKAGGFYPSLFCPPLVKISLTGRYYFPYSTITITIPHGFTGSSKGTMGREIQESGTIPEEVLLYLLEAGVAPYLTGWRKSCG